MRGVIVLLCAALLVGSGCARFDQAQSQPFTTKPELKPGPSSTPPPPPPLPPKPFPKVCPAPGVMQGCLESTSGLIMGPDSRNVRNESDLVHLPGSAYSDPEFSFASPAAPTSIAFLADSVLGDAYRDAVLVAAYRRGGLFLLRLNDARDGFVLDGALRDLVADGTGEEAPLRFASGFGTITDLQVGPDGALYALGYDLGNLYRITPEPGALGLVSIPALLLLRRRRPTDR